MIFSHIYDFLFGLPPVEKRPRKSFWLNEFAVGDYDPACIESYALYKAVKLGVILNLLCMGYFLLPVLFSIPEGILNKAPLEPVTFFKNNSRVEPSLQNLAVMHPHTNAQARLFFAD